MNRYSPSKFKTFDMCKLQYKLNYIDKIHIPQPMNQDTQFGKLIHKMFEVYNGENKIELVKLVKNYHLDDKYKSFIASTIKNFFKFYDKYGKFEHKTEKNYELKNDNYWLYGVVDRIIIKPEELIVIDYKTSATPSSDNHSFQMKFYNLMLSKLFNRENNQVKCMLYFPRPHAEEKFLFSNIEMMEYEEKLKNTIINIETNQSWEPTNGYHCKWCAYKNKYCSK